VKRVQHQQDGFVLHTRPYRESSLLVDVFCRGHGRFMLNAKGARRQKSGMRGVLMPFQPLLLSWSGRGQLQILTAAESRGHLPTLTGDALHSGFYMNELLLKLLHRFDEHDALFDQYDHAVKALANAGDVGRTLRVFEKSIMGETGFGLVLDHDADTGESIDAKARYRYIPEHGPVRESAGSDRGVSISGSALISLREEREPLDATRHEIRNLHRILIGCQLGRHEMRTRNVLLQVQDRLRRAGHNGDMDIER